MLSIPACNRIPAMLHDKEIGYNTLLTAVTAALSSAMANLNLRVGVNAGQLCDIADAILSEAEEDNLALEDVLLFLQQLSTGKAGKIFDRMDMPTFFELFETYRQDRHLTTIRVREEQQAQYKGLGDTNRTEWQLADEEWRSARDLLIAQYDLKQKSDQQAGPPGATAEVL